MAGGGHPVEHDVGQHRVAAEIAVEIAAVIAPGVESFDDPGRTRSAKGRDLFIVARIALPNASRAVIKLRAAFHQS